MIAYSEDKNNPEGRWKGYIFAISMFAVATVQSLALQQYFHIVFILGLKVRTAVIGMVYSKVLCSVGVLKTYSKLQGYSRHFLFPT